MNANCYKVIFSKRLGALVAVGEHTSSCGKAASGQGTRTAAAGFDFTGVVKLCAAAVLIACCPTQLALAQTLASNVLPTQGVVQTGSASINSNGANMAITQSTDKASINWQSFSIGSAASVNITQPHAQAVLLNRVVGNDPSQILGKLSANGQVILLNPNGIVFGKDGSVTASSFTASTFALSDADVMSGYYKYNRNGSTASVVNNGNIQVASGGYVALMGAEVTNNGTITAPQGVVVMAAAESVALPAEVTAPRSVGVPLSKRVRLELAPAAVNTAVNNTENGVIVTEGGQVLMQAGALATAVASVTHSGNIDTSGPQAGDVTLLADGGRIKVDGRITANSTGQDSQGHANVGGRIVIGRDEDTGVLAKATNVSDANLESKGGFVETSGEYLKTDGVSVKAAEWLLDPTDINIVAVGTVTPDTPSSNVGGVTGTTTFQETSGINTSEVLKSDIESAINAGTSVTITTANPTAGANGAGNITLSTALAFANNSNTDATLSLIAVNGITQNAGSTITTSAVAGKTGLVNISMTANGNYQGNTSNNASSKGITIQDDIITNGDLTMNGTIKTTSGAGIAFTGKSSPTYLNIKANKITLAGTALASTNGSQFNGISFSNYLNFESTGTDTSTLTGISSSNSVVGAGIFAADGTNLKLTGNFVLDGQNTNLNYRGVRFGYTADTGVITTSGDVTFKNTAGTAVTILDTGTATTTQNAQLLLRGTMNVNSGKVSFVGGSYVDLYASSNIRMADNTELNFNSRQVQIGDAGGASISKSGTGGYNVNITTDTLTYTSGSTINAGTGTVNITNRTANRDISIGGGATGLGITTAAVNGITAGNLVIGDTSNTGGISFDGAFTAPSNTTIQTGSASGISGTAAAIINNNGKTLTFNTTNAAAAGNLQSVISNTGSLIKTGAGSLILSGNNTYTGTTTVSGGTLQIGNNGATGTLGTGDVTLSNGSNLLFKRAAATTISNRITAGDGTGGNLRADISAGGLTVNTPQTSVLGNIVLSTQGGAISIAPTSGTSSISGNNITVDNRGSTIANDGTITTAGALLNSGGTGIGLTSTTLTSANLLQVYGSSSTTAPGIWMNSANLKTTGSNVNNIVKGIATTNTNLGPWGTGAGGSALYVEGASSFDAGTGNLLAIGEAASSAHGLRVNNALNLYGSVYLKGQSASGIGFTNLGLVQGNSGSVTVEGISTSHVGLYTWNGAIRTLGSYNLTLKGTSSDRDGIQLAQAVSTVSGNLYLIGSGGSSGSGLYNTNTITSTSGNIDIAVNTAAISSSILASSGTVTVRGTTDGRAIKLGAADAAAAGGNIGLTNAELNFITATKTIIGSTTAGSAAGDISVDAAITTNSTSGNLELKTAGNVTINNALTVGASGAKNLTITATGANSAVSGTAVITANQLAITANTVALNTAANQVNSLAASTTGSFAFKNGKAITLTTVDGITGIVTSGGASVETTTGDLTLAQDVTNTTSGNVVLSAGSATAAGTSTGGDVKTTGGDVNQYAGGTTKIYTGSSANTSAISNLVNGFSADLRLADMDGTHLQNTKANSGNGASITGSTETTQIFLREKVNLGATLSNATATYGDALAGTDIQTLLTAANTQTISKTSTAGTFKIKASSLVDAMDATALGASASFTGHLTGSYLNASATPYALDITSDFTGVSASLLVNKATLSASLSGTAAKNYDGNDTATLAAGNYNFSGFASGEGASVTQTTGTYSSPNANSNTVGAKGVVTATLASGDYTANAGTDLANYTLPTSASGNIGVITPVALTATVNDSAIFVTQAGSSAPDMGVSYSGFVGTDTAASALTGSYVRSYTGVDPLAVGTYSGVFGLSSTPTINGGNYTLSVTAGGLTVVPADKLLITINSQSASFGSQTTANAGTAAVGSVSAVYCLNQGIACTGANLYNLTTTRLSSNQWKAADNTGSYVVFDTSVASPVYTNGTDLDMGNYTYTATEINPLSLYTNGVANFNGRFTNGGVLTITAASGGGGGGSGSGSSSNTIVKPPLPIMPSDAGSGGGSSGGDASAANPYIVLPSSGQANDRCNANNLEACLCEEQPEAPIQNLAICYQPKKTAETKSTKNKI